MSRTRRRLARRAATCAVTAIATVAGLAAPAGANDPLAVCAEATGTVVDPWGNGVPDVAVEWVAGNTRCTPLVATNAAGRYSTQLRVSTTPSQVRASSLFTSSRVQAMQPDIQTTDMSTHDFKLWYLLTTPAASPAYVKPGGAVTLTVRSSAPAMHASPGSKVLAQVGTAPGVVMDQGATEPDGRFTRWSLPITAGSSEGRRDVTFCAVRATYPGTSCAQAAALGETVAAVAATASFVVDGTAPDTLGGRIFPLSGTQTQFTSQALSAVVTDPTAGFSASSAVFTLTDTTTGAVTTHRGVAVSDEWVRTAPVSLTPGHVYRAALTVTDRAGNARTVSQNDLSSGGGFRVVNMTMPPAVARILDPVRCTLGAPDYHVFPPQRTATCSNVPVVADPVDVSLSESAHGGDSWITQHVTLSNLKVHATAAGVELEAVTPPTRTVDLTQRFRLADRAPEDVSVATTKGEATLDTIQVRVPAAADDAYLDMAPTTAQNVTGAACAAPWAATTFCSPDPVPPVTSGMRIDDVVAVTGGSVAVSLNGGNVAGLAILGSAVERETRTRDDGTTVEGLGVAPPEPVTPESAAISTSILDAADLTLNGRQCIVDNLRYLRPNSLRMQNDVLRRVELGDRGETLMVASCGGGSTYDYPDDIEGGSVDNSCWVEHDGGAMQSEASQDRVPAYKRVYLHGCYSRTNFGTSQQTGKHYYADVSRVRAQTCDPNNSKCTEVVDLGVRHEVHYRLKIVTAAHSYYPSEKDALSGGLVYSRNPDSLQVFPHSCEQVTNSQAFEIKIDKAGAGAGGEWVTTRQRTECKEHAVPSEGAGRIHGVDWRGDAPSGGLGQRVSVAGNGVSIWNDHASNFKFHMDALTDPPT